MQELLSGPNFFNGTGTKNGTRNKRGPGPGAALVWEQDRDQDLPNSKFTMKKNIKVARVLFLFDINKQICLLNIHKRTETNSFFF